MTLHKSDKSVVVTSVGEVKEQPSPSSDEMQRFTATGKPFVAPEHSGLASAQLDDFTAGRPNHVPWKFTDDTLITIPVLADALDDSAVADDKSKHKGWGSKLKDKLSGQDKSSFRLVQVKRGDYLKYFARDEQGVYCGTEPEGMGLELLRERERLEKERLERERPERERLERERLERERLEKEERGAIGELKRHTKSALRSVATYDIFST